MTLDATLRKQLLDLASLDHETRAELATSGELGAGYHPRMAAVHAENAEALIRIIDATGWPGTSRVGDDGANAAWLILQHAIANPALQKRCLPLIRQAVENGEAPAHQAAYLEDRIACFERRPQKFGTQFDWDDNGEMSPLPLADDARVDEYRASVGLNSLAERTREIRSELVNVNPPENRKEWRRQKRAWAESVGWIQHEMGED